MRTSDYGISFIKSHEGLRLKAYKALPTEQYYTIGYGHYGADVEKDKIINGMDAENLLRADLIKFETAVTGTGLQLNQNQFDALVSFAYNCGVGNLKTLVKNRNTLQIAEAMLLYTKAGGKEISGLVTRRKHEHDLFVTPMRTKSNREVAIEVLDRKWGNGADRRNRLEAAGYNYNEVQAEVNRLVKERNGA